MSCSVFHGQNKSVNLLTVYTDLQSNRRSNAQHIPKQNKHEKENNDEYSEEEEEEKCKKNDKKSGKANQKQKQEGKEGMKKTFSVILCHCVECQDYEAMNEIRKDYCVPYSIWCAIPTYYLLAPCS